MSEYADVESIIREAMEAWRPPPRLSLSAWADEYFYLSSESAADAGRWRTLPYQRGWMDAFTDPLVEQITVMKSARVGYTKTLNAVVGYHMHQAPCPIMVVQPTVDDAQGYSKEEIAPMQRDCPVLARIILEEAEEKGPKDSANTILHKKFPGGVLSMIGANSGAGFRRVSRRVLLFDEVDGYPESAGSDGDPISLGIKRTQAYHDRKIGAGSTPLVAGSSRIERLFEAGDQRRYYVPCPQCGHMAPLVFRGDKGHAMQWPEGKPDEAYFACQANGCVIEHKDKRAMVEAGEWRAEKPYTDEARQKGSLHVSFHIWTAYSYLPKAEWKHIAAEFLEARGNPQTLRTFVNTVLGETWKEQGEAPEWQRLYGRRERYPIGSVPEGVAFLTAGVDVQKDRFVYEVVGWGAGKESWSVDAGVLPANTADPREWARLDELLGRDFEGHAIRTLAVDSGFNTQAVYSWARRYPSSRVLAVKGSAGAARALVSSPTKVDVTERGKRLPRGCQVWAVGVDIAKAELYGWLQLQLPEKGQPFPPGYCHFPEYGQDFFQQLTAEQLQQVKDRKGHVRHEWVKVGAENHWLDARVYARAAAAVAGLDRMRAPPRNTAEVVAEFARAVADAQGEARAAPPPPAPAPPVPVPPPRLQRTRQPGGFLSGSRPFRGKGWLK